MSEYTALGEREKNKESKRKNFFMTNSEIYAFIANKRQQFVVCLLYICFKLYFLMASHKKLKS